jgi:hypothetical protein
VERASRKLPQHVEAREAGHRDVEEDHVGRPREERVHGLEAVRGLLDHERRVGVREKAHEALPREGLVVHHEDAPAHEAVSSALKRASVRPEGSVSSVKPCRPSP